MNERIENTYTRSGRIANPTEQEILILEAVELQIRPSRSVPNSVFQMYCRKKKE